MKHFEVINPVTATSFGIFSSETEQGAIDKACADAGYESQADMLARLDKTESDLIAIEVTI